MKKYIIGLLSGIVIASVVNVYATIYYEASQINYKNTTLDHAIDDLYTTQNTTVSILNSTISTQNGTISNLQTSLNDYKSISLRMQCNSTGTGYGTANVFIDNKKVLKYKYFKITLNSTNEYLKSYGVRGGKSDGSGNVDISLNTQYLTSDYTATWVNCSSNSTSNTNNIARVDYNVLLYN